MKYAKKAAVLLLVLVMMMSLSVSAYATGGDPDPDPAAPETQTGTINVTKALYDSEYSIYRIADLESYNKEAGHYSYKINADWAGLMEWKNADGTYVINGVYLKYMDNTKKDYIVWDKNPSTDNDWRAFAKLCLQYAEETGITPVGTKTTGAAPAGSAADATTTVTFTDLPLGYYLVDSSAGLVCSLDTTDHTVDIEEKNLQPTVTKQVKEDSNGLGAENDADIGQLIEFQSDIKIRENNNVIFHDKMSEGLDFVYDASTEWNNDGASLPADKEDNITVEIYKETDGADSARILIEGTDYTVIKGALTAPDPVDDCTFHIKFGDSVYNAIKANPKTIYHVIVTYHGKLNEKAQVGPDTGNTNMSKVTFGDTNKSSNESQTTTKTYEFKVFKYTNGTGNTKNGLAGAEFTLKLKATGEAAEISVGEDIQFVVVTAGDDTTEAVYRVATPEEIADANVEKVTTIVTNKTGKFVIKGLDASSYLLTETKAPDGFNKLDEPATVTIGKNGTTASAINGYNEIMNNSGTELPSTGGTGTTVFYALGGALVLAAAVLLVTKRRMGAER